MCNNLSWKNTRNIEFGKEEWTLPWHDLIISPRCWFTLRLSPTFMWLKILRLHETFFLGISYFRGGWGGGAGTMKEIINYLKYLRSHKFRVTSSFLIIRNCNDLFRSQCWERAFGWLYSQEERDVPRSGISCFLTQWIKFIASFYG